MSPRCDCFRLPGRELGVLIAVLGLLLVPTRGMGAEEDAAAGRVRAEQEAPVQDAVADPETAEGRVESHPGGPEHDDLPWELKPYRVLVSLALADRATFPQRFSDETTTKLQQLISGGVGSYWESTIEINQWLFPQHASAVAELSSEQLTNRYVKSRFDKVLLVVLEEDNSRYRLTGCEWDRATQERGPTHQRPVVDRRHVPEAAFDFLTDLARPLARIDFSEGAFAELRVRGGELLGPDTPLFPFAVGDLLTGHFRYLDRDREVRQIQGIPWTYLRVASINRSRMTATIESPFTNPFGGTRRRVELVAIETVPRYGTTKLKLTPRTNPGRPLIGVRVRVYDELPNEANPNPEYTELMTDRKGLVTLTASSERPLCRLIVHSGGAVLSNVPFVPGVERQVTMELPDDSPRLQVEGSLAMVQGDLIDVVSRRIVMLARAVSLARKENFEEAERLLKEVDAQPSIGSFESRILAIRVPGVEKARANRNRAQEKRIRMMCSELEDLVHKYLGRQSVDEVKAEVSELKKIAGS